MNTNGGLDSGDAALVLQFTSGLISSLPIELTVVGSTATGSFSIGSLSRTQGSAGDVDVTANITDPGLGAWAVDIGYDKDVITATDCTAEQGSVCNADFADDTVRSVGASAAGLVGTLTLASISFRCMEVGVSDLTIFVRFNADATIGNNQPFAVARQNGSITCGPFI